MSKLSRYIFRRDSGAMIAAPHLQAGGPLSNPPLIDNPYEEETTDLYRSTRKTTLGNMFGSKED